MRRNTRRTTGSSRLLRGATVRGPTRPVDALQSTPRTLVGGVLAASLALVGVAAIAYPVFGLVAGATALVTVVALRRRDTRSARSASSEAQTARQRAGVEQSDATSNDETTDASPSPCCEPAD